MAQQQKLGLACRYARQDGSHAALLLRGGEHFLRSARMLAPWKERLIPGPARTAPKLIQSQPYCRAMQPRPHPFAVRFRMPAELQESFDREFLRAAVITNDPGNGAGDGLIVSREDSLEIRSGELRARRPHSVAYVHNLETPVAL